MSGAALFFALASLGLPGLGDFVGEFLVLLGSYRPASDHGGGSLGSWRPRSMLSRLVQRVSRAPPLIPGGSRT